MLVAVPVQVMAQGVGGDQAKAVLLGNILKYYSGHINILIFTD